MPRSLRSARHLFAKHNLSLNLDKRTLKRRQSRARNALRSRCRARSSSTRPDLLDIQADLVTPANAPASSEHHISSSTRRQKSRPATRDGLGLIAQQDARAPRLAHGFRGLATSPGDGAGRGLESKQQTRKAAKDAISARVGRLVGHRVESRLEARRAPRPRRQSQNSSRCSSRKRDEHKKKRACSRTGHFINGLQFVVGQSMLLLV